MKFFNKFRLLAVLGVIVLTLIFWLVVSYGYLMLTEGPVELKDWINFVRLLLLYPLVALWSLLSGRIDYRLTDFNELTEILPYSPYPYIVINLLIYATVVSLYKRKIKTRQK